MARSEESGDRGSLLCGSEETRRGLTEECTAAVDEVYSSWLAGPVGVDVCLSEDHSRQSIGSAPDHGGNQENGRTFEGSLCGREEIVRVSACPLGW